MGWRGDGRESVGGEDEGKQALDGTASSSGGWGSCNTLGAR